MLKTKIEFIELELFLKTHLPPHGKKNILPHEFN